MVPRRDEEENLCFTYVEKYTTVWRREICLFGGLLQERSTKDIEES